MGCITKGINKSSNANYCWVLVKNKDEGDYVSNENITIYFNETLANQELSELNTDDTKYIWYSIEKIVSFEPKPKPIFITAINKKVTEADAEHLHNMLTGAMPDYHNLVIVADVEDVRYEVLNGKPLEEIDEAFVKDKIKQWQTNTQS